MTKVIYILSTLKRAGPVNQLLNIIKYLDKKTFEPYVITLSPEPHDSLYKAYMMANVSVFQLKLSRFQGLFYAKEKIENLISKIKPDIIHTQGIRPDVLVSKLRLSTPWFLTVRNYPFFDYPQKYGYLKGYPMAINHIRAIKRCKNAVACSNTISNLLSRHEIQSISIQNGVEVKKSNNIDMPYSRPIFITVGSLIPRKNTSFLIEAFKKYTQDLNKGSLVILGDGPQKKELTAISPKRVHFLGNVPNVSDFLFRSDYFLSSSLAEGLPNTVLEALASRLPVLLSNIPSHYEISDECPNASRIFKLEGGPCALAELMAKCPQLFSQEAKSEAGKVMQSTFSAKAMSQKYQNLYLSRVEQ